MLVDYKLCSRDHKKSLFVREAVVDPSLEVTLVPMNWLDALRSVSVRLPSGYFKEVAEDFSLKGRDGSLNGVCAGPVVMYIVGQSSPVVLYPWFVKESYGCFSLGEKSEDELDLRVGLDAIVQCQLFSELRPGGLLRYSVNGSKLSQTSLPSETAHDVLQTYGMKCGLSASPLVRRPWTRMKHMFVNELQRGPKLTEFVGHNPRSGTEWRFSQHCKHFRQGIWRDLVRRNEMNGGVHANSSWQKSPQQSVPEVSFMAPFP